MIRIASIVMLCPPFALGTPVVSDYPTYCVMGRMDRNVVYGRIDSYTTNGRVDTYSVLGKIEECEG